MPEQTSFRPRVVRRGGGVRNAEDRGPENDSRGDKEMDQHDRGYDQRDSRRRYPRVLNPMSRRGERGYRYGGPRRYNNDADRDYEDMPPRRPRRPRTRTDSNQKAAPERHEVDSARENSGAETDEEPVQRRRNRKTSEPKEPKESKPKAPRKKPARPQARISRVRRQRLPKVYAPKEFLEVQEPIDHLNKRLDDKKEFDEDELQEAIKELVKYFEDAEGKNPYELALKMLMVAVGYDRANILYTPILRALDLVLRGEEVKENCLTDDVQEAAYVLSHVSHLSACADELRDLFELKELPAEKMNLFIAALIKQHLYREALREILDNELEKKFEMEQIIAPMLVQHIIYPLEDMFNKNPYYLEPTIRYMDKVIGMSYNDMSAEVEKYDVPRVLGLGRQFLVRLILSWKDAYKFELEWCPNIKNFFALQQLYYLNRRRFRNTDMPYINWMELTVALVEGNPDISKELVDELVRYNFPSEAKYWADRYGVKEDQMAAPVIESLKGVTEPFDLEKAKGETLKPKEGRTVLEIDIDENTIKFVDKEHECVQAFDDLNGKDRVGLDVQYRPETGLSRTVALLVIAHPDGVYLIDVNALNSTSALVDGLRKLLDNPKVTKIGFNINGDLTLLGQALKTEFKVEGADHVVNLRVVQDKFYRGQLDFLFPNADRRDFKRRSYNYEVRILWGLNSLVKAVFGKNLDRSEVTSNWDNRPLRPAQSKSASVGALVLIKLYDQLAEEAKKNEKDFGEILKPIPYDARRRGGKDGDNRSGGEDGAGTDSAGEKTGDESGRNSRNETERRPRYDYGGYGRYGLRGRGRGRGMGGRFRGGYYGGAYAKPRVPRDSSHPPAAKAEEILEDGKVPEIMTSPKKPKDLKIVVDSMLRGLARALTERGMDVVALRHKDRHNECVDKSNQEKRVILTQGRIFYEMKDQVPSGYCFKVVTKTVDQQVEEVFKAYSVDPEEVKSEVKEAEVGADAEAVASN